QPQRQLSVSCSERKNPDRRVVENCTTMDKDYLPPMACIDPDETFPCPYDPHHLVRASRFPYHIVQCRKNNPHIAKRMKACPFNARHIILKTEMERHVMRCPDKTTIAQDLEIGGALGRVQNLRRQYCWVTQVNLISYSLNMSTVLTVIVLFLNIFCGGGGGWKSLKTCKNAKKKIEILLKKKLQNFFFL
uniref:CHHC U11-48K-type domain-containing protein n=1 Tax=Eptatretus burgeri TaxID=7764 RepID=A0A8C4WQK6_EPTBU